MEPQHEAADRDVGDVGERRARDACRPVSRRCRRGRRRPGLAARRRDRAAAGPVFSPGRRRRAADRAAAASPRPPCRRARASQRPAANSSRRAGVFDHRELGADDRRQRHAHPLGSPLRRAAASAPPSTASRTARACGLCEPTNSRSRGWNGSAAQSAIWKRDADPRPRARPPTPRPRVPASPRTPSGSP